MIQLNMLRPTFLIGALLLVLLRPSGFGHSLTNDSSNSFLLSSENEQRMPNDEDAGEYLINTTQCLVERHPLFDKDTAEFYERYPNLNAGYPDCSGKSSGIERYNFTWIRIPQSLFDKGCSVTRIERDATNDGVKRGQRIAHLNTTLIEFPDWDAAQVVCGQERAVIALIPNKAPFNYSDLPKPKFDNKKPINVLMLGIDSMSRLNFKRHFLQTDALLKTVGFQPFYGHHKVGDNTLPNILPMMLGESMDTTFAWLNQISMDVLDPLPFIQKYYSNAGYLTTFIEDMPNYGTFNGRFVTNLVQRMGHQLTEYYMRPVNLELTKQLYTMHQVCYENRLEVEYYYDYLLDLLRSHQVRGHAHFTWIHISTITHHDLNLCQYLDRPLHRLLSAIFNESFHQNTIIMLYSDHALRLDNPILHTDSFFHEKRLPLLYVYTPEHVRLMNENGQWLNTEDLQKILSGNAHSLTSHMDIHATLSHILTGNSLPLPGPNLTDTKSYGKSLFTPISSERTCADAGIPSELCLCAFYRPFKSKGVAEATAKEIVRHINQNILKLSIFEDRCQQHEFAQVLQAKAREQPGKSGRTVFLILLFATSNGAEFEVNVKFPHSQESGIFPIEIVGQITRANRYAEQSFCVRHLNLLNHFETFCVCK